MSNEEKIKKLTDISSAFGEIGVVIIEKNSNAEFIKEEIKNILKSFGYENAQNYLEIMNSMEKQTPVFYAEKEKTANNLVSEIIKEYKGGIVSLMDRFKHSGLKTIKFVPKKSPFILILTREQIEGGFNNFFEFVGPMESF